MKLITIANIHRTLHAHLVSPSTRKTFMDLIVTKAQKVDPRKIGTGLFYLLKDLSRIAETTNDEEFLDELIDLYSICAVANPSKARQAESVMA